MTPFVSVSVSSAARGSVSLAKRANGRGERMRAIPRANTEVRRFVAALALVTFTVFSFVALPSLEARADFAVAFALLAPDAVFIS